jgi:hypothetical protein
VKQKESYDQRRHCSPAAHQRFPRVVRTVKAARSDARRPLRMTRRNRSHLEHLTSGASRALRGLRFTFHPWPPPCAQRSHATPRLAPAHPTHRPFTPDEQSNPRHCHTGSHTSNAAPPLTANVTQIGGLSYSASICPISRSFPHRSDRLLRRLEAPPVGRGCSQAPCVAHPANGTRAVRCACDGVRAISLHAHCISHRPVQEILSRSSLWTTCMLDIFSGRPHLCRAAVV